MHPLREIACSKVNEDNSSFFKDEFNPHLKPTHRGLLLMCNLNEPDTNTSQFCITFDTTEELYKKNTVFGRIRGDSIYNLKKIERVKIDENERPIGEGVRIERVDVIENPFDDVFVRDIRNLRPDLFQTKSEDISGSDIFRKKRNRKGGKEKIKTLMSFADEEEDEIEVKKSKRRKIASPFDILKNDVTLSKENPISIEEERKMKEAKEKKLERERLKTMVANPEEDSSLLKKRLPEKSIENSKVKKVRMREDLLALKDNKVEGVRVKKNSKTGRYEIAFDSNSNSRSSSTSSSSSSEGDEEEDEEMINPTNLKFKKNQTGSLNLAGRKSLAEEKKLLSRVELKRYKYLKNPINSIKVQKNENDVEEVPGSTYMNQSASSNILFNAPSLSMNANINVTQNISKLNIETKKKEEEVEDKYKFKNTVDKYKRKQEKSKEEKIVDEDNENKPSLAEKIKEVKIPVKQDLTVLDKLKAFQDRISNKKKSKGKFFWMNSKLKFHVDSDNAYKAIENRNMVGEFRGLGIIDKGSVAEKQGKEEVVEGREKGEIGMETAKILSEVVGFGDEDLKDIIN